MAAPVGAVWLADEHRYRTAEEQTEGTMPANLWLIGYSHMVLPARTLPARRDDWSRPPTLSATVWQAIIRKGATKPRNMPYDKSALSFHNGCAAVVYAPDGTGRWLLPRLPVVLPGRRLVGRRDHTVQAQTRGKPRLPSLLHCTRTWLLCAPELPCLALCARWHRPVAPAQAPCGLAGASSRRPARPHCVQRT